MNRTNFSCFPTPKFIVHVLNFLFFFYYFGLISVALIFRIRAWSNFLMSHKKNVSISSEFFFVKYQCFPYIWSEHLWFFSWFGRHFLTYPDTITAALIVASAVSFQCFIDFGLISVALLFRIRACS